MHSNIYDAFHSQYSQQLVSVGVSAIFMVMILYKNSKYNCLVFEL